MLSLRVFLTLALVGALLAPAALADDPLDSSPDTASLEEQTQAAQEAAAAEQEEAERSAEGGKRDAERSLRELGLPDDEQSLQAAVEDAPDKVQSELEAFLHSLGVDVIAQEIKDLVEGTDPESLLPIAEIFGEAPEREPQAAEVQTTTTSGDWQVPTKPLVILASTAAAAGIAFWIAGSSGTLGAAGSAGSTAAAQSANRRFLPFASPMFTRFEKDTVLDHPKREQLYGMVVVKPGITLQDLCEGTGLSRTAVSHHLRLMEQQHIIVSKRVGRSRHFFENGGRYGRDQKDAYAVLHNERSAEVHSFIEGHPGSIQKDLCDALGIQASVAHWHVKRLVEANLIEAVRQGRTVSYFPTQALQPVMA